MFSKSIYACMPFVELPALEEGISFGPITFWPLSSIDNQVHESFSPLLKDYLHRIIRSKLPIQSIACISIDDAIDPDLREPLLIDALYLLYFAASFRNVYHGTEILKLRSFTKILPAYEEFVREKNNWEKISLSKREEVACILTIDKRVCDALGEELSIAWQPRKSDSQKQDRAIRIIRAIRYFVDRFFNKFENVCNAGLKMNSKLFEPEDTLFLACSFDVLLNIDDTLPSSDFRQKLRPMLQLKFSRPLELFWKWVDAFFLLKKQVIHGTQSPSDLFIDNPHFKVPLLHIGVKLFIYIIYYSLFKEQLIEAKGDTAHKPPDFKWIHPQEVLFYFWTEESILRKISILLMQKSSEENTSDLEFLSSLYVTFMERFYTKQKEHIGFQPASKAEILPYFDIIQDRGKDLLPSNFLQWFKERSKV